MKNIFIRKLKTVSRLAFGSFLILIFVASNVLPFASNGPDTRATEHEKVTDLSSASIVEEQSCLYGGVEIGASGVKAIAIRVKETTDGYKATEVFSPKTANTNIMLDVAKTRLMRQDRIDETAKAVGAFCDQILALGVPADQLYVVASSGVRADNMSELASKVLELTKVQMTFLTVDDEVNYAISGAVPPKTSVYIRSRRYSNHRKGRKYRWIRTKKKVDNRGRSVFIDIGSGNTKGGYQERVSNTGPLEYRVVSFGIPFGTKTLADRVSKQLPAEPKDIDFSHATTSVYSETFSEPLRLAISTKPGLENRSRVYLSGGIVWAVATLIHPEDRSPYVTLTAADIDRFYEEVVGDLPKLLNPDLSRLDAETREKVESDVNAIQSTFSPKQLIAGAQILKSLSNDLKFAQNRRHIRFVRAGYIAWILRYVNLKSTESTDCQ